MRVLLDTHTFIWQITGDAKLSRKAIDLLTDTRNQLLLSFASEWEMAIKVSTGNLEIIKGNFDEFMDSELAANDIARLPITPLHMAQVARLPRLQHRDPFDRMIIAQAMVEDVPIVGADIAFDDYPIRRMWE